MLFCDTAGSEKSDFDAVLCFVSQLRGHGIPAVIHEASVPDDINAAQEFDLAPLLTSATPCNGDRAIIVSAEQLDGESQIRLRARFGRYGIPCVAFGTFETRQAMVSTQSRLAYAFSREPDLHEVAPCGGLPRAGVPIFGAPLPQGGTARNRPRLLLAFPDTEDGAVASAILAAAGDPGFDLELLLDGNRKTGWRSQNGDTIPAWHLGELPPRAFAARFDGAIFYAPPAVWPRLQMVVANLASAGALLADATLERHWSNDTPEFVAAPSDPGSLATWLNGQVLRNLPLVRTELLSSRLVRDLAMPAALRQLQPPPRVLAERRQEKDPRRIVFMPTNGVGLGHAKRCSLIAHEMRDRCDPVFAAFPSCVGMLTRSGFDAIPLVGRTPLRPPQANDLVNHARLDGIARQAGGIVFDGGYVFDSVMRASTENAVPSIWVRRGLWQASQNNSVAKDRQKIFSSILVPTELFDELNGREDRSETVTSVGPVVHRTELSGQETADIRSSLARTLGLEGDKLVVTMLGGGVAADRKAQINALAAHLSTRPDVMHVVVVWPTATTDPAWFQHRNTRVVRTLHAGPLVQAADVFVSAIGYNSFHEAIYGAVASIFVPQMAGFMDDQRARGRAAAERGLAIMVEPWEFATLTRAVDECLEGRSGDLRDALSRMNLPETGNRQAAEHILEVFG